jgi:hypothetical protein
MDETSAFISLLGANAQRKILILFGTWTQTSGGNFFFLLQVVNCFRVGAIAEEVSNNLTKKSRNLF